MLFARIPTPYFVSDGSLLLLKNLDFISTRPAAKRATDKGTFFEGGTKSSSVST